MASSLTLADIPVGSSVRVARIAAIGPMRRRLLDLGLVPGARVGVLLRAPAGDPTAYWIKGAVIALRNQDAARITVTRY